MKGVSFAMQVLIVVIVILIVAIVVLSIVAGGFQNIGTFIGQLFPGADSACAASNCHTGTCPPGQAIDLSKTCSLGQVCCSGTTPSG